MTNYSRWEHASSLRGCLKGAAARTTQQKLLDLALQRLGTFAHVGVTEMMEESVGSLAAILGMRMEGRSWQVLSADVKSAFKPHISHYLMPYCCCLWTGTQA